MGKDETKRLDLEIAKSVGEPIDPTLPVPVAITEIADVFTAEPGEKIWRYSQFDPNAGDYVRVVLGSGAITTVKRTPTGDAELTFSGLNSKMEYVLIDEILAETDNTSVLARRKRSITRAMDKKEVKNIVDALLAKTAGYLPGVDPHEYTTVTGDDIYDAIIGMKHLVEDYGDNFVLLVGSTVKERIDTFDKEKASTLNYSVDLIGRLEKVGIKIVKMFGQVESTATGGAENVMDKKKMILVARDSTIAEGKPIKFVRRIINADIARLMGAEVDSAQRALVVGGTPVNLAGVNTLAYSIYGYESQIFTITNPKAICICDATGILA